MAMTRGAAAWQNFVRSNWITAGWNWLLGLVGKAAEAVLAVTILYSTVQVFTTTDPHVDLGMFLAQQAALDIGGLGLIKLANQAKRDGLLEEAAKARKVSIILMVLMVIGVIVANVESKITTTVPTLDAAHHLITTVLSFQQSYPVAAIIIEILLLIARGTMAVVYGFTIHDLASSQPEQQPTQPSAPAIDIQEIVRKELEAQAAKYEEHLAEREANYTQRVNLLQIQQSTALSQLREEQSTALSQMRVTIIENGTGTSGTKQLPSPASGTNRTAGTKQLGTSASGTRQLAPASGTSSVPDGQPSNVLPMHKVSQVSPATGGERTAAEIETDSVVWPLLDAGKTVRAIETETSINKSKVGRSRVRWATANGTSASETSDLSQDAEADSGTDENGTSDLSQDEQSA
jgi:hypothetical protein